MPPQLGHSILHAHTHTRTAHAHARRHDSARGVGNAWLAAALRARKGRPSRSYARRVPWHPGPKMGPRCGFDQAGSRSDALFARARPPAWPLASRRKNCPARTGPVEGGEPARRPARAWPGERDIPLLQHINGASVSRAGRAPGPGHHARTDSSCECVLFGSHAPPLSIVPRHPAQNAREVLFSRKQHVHTGGC